MEFKFRPGNASEAKPLVGFYSESDGGKTFSALMLARGFVGPQGRIGMIETESGRGEAYVSREKYPEFAGPNEANYDVLPLRDDFSPENYGKAISAAEKAKLDALIIDSASHEWEGIGGVLAMAAENQAAGKRGPIVWQKPKIDHQRHFMLRFMQTSIPLVILCMRAKYPMMEIKKSDGTKDWVRSDKLEPKQADDILFEMFIHGWFSKDHHFHPSRLTGRGLESVFPDDQMITLETGRKLRAWAKGERIIDEELERLRQMARDAAAGGNKALTDWLKTRTKDEGAKLMSIGAELRQIANECDSLAGGGGQAA